MNHNRITRYATALLMAGAGLGMQSCDDAAKIAPVELGAPTKEFIIDSDAATLEIPVYSNGSYHIESISDESDWISLDRWEGSGDGTIYAECSFNEEFKRMAGLVFCSDVDSRRDTVYVKQKGLLTEVLSLSNSSVIAAGAGGVTEAPVITNIPYEDMTVSIVYSDEADVDWITSTSIEEDPNGGTNCTMLFTTEANGEQVKPRTAEVTFTFVGGWGDSISVVINFIQRNAKEGLGEVLSIADIKNGYSTGKEIDDYIILEGLVVSNPAGGNSGENEQITTSTIDYTGCTKTVYIESIDGVEGLCVVMSSADDNVFQQYDHVQILLHGTTLTMYESPERYTLSNVTKAMVVSQVGGSKSDIPVKELYMNQLTDKDLYTYVTLKDCELPIRKGSIAPINEGYTNATGAHRLSKYPLLVRDINGDSMYMYTNTTCWYRNDGTRLPYGSGKLSGVLVHERFSRFTWRNGADPADMEDDVTLGNIGTYQLRHQTKDDVWGQMNDSVENSFSALLTEYRFWNPDTENGVCLPTYGENGWLTHTYQEKYTGKESKNYTMATYNQHMWGGATYDYLGPAGNSTNYPFGDNWGNHNGLGIVLDPEKEHYNSKMEAYISHNPDGTIEYGGPYATSKDIVNNTAKGAGGINNQSTSMCGKNNVYGACYTGFGSHFWWDDDTDRPYSWLINFSTKGISTTCLSMQISVMNSQQTWYAPRFWVAEWAETDSQDAADDVLWHTIEEYTVPDVSVWSNTLFSSLVAFKCINFRLPLEMLGKDNVYIRLHPTSDLCSDGSDYANARLAESSKGAAEAAEHASVISYIAIRYNK